MLDRRWVPFGCENKFVKCISCFPTASLVSALLVQAPAALAEGNAGLKNGVSLQQTMKLEVEGQIIDRTQMLRPEEANEESAKTQSRWQTGQLRDNGKWTAMDGLEPSEASRRYQTERGNRPLTVEDHRRLAVWCSTHHAPDQARAHWTAVLQTNPNDVEARQATGAQRIGDRWFAQEELKRIAAQNQSNVESLKTWMPKIRNWVAALEGNDTKKKLKAIEQVRAIQAPQSIFALQMAAQQVQGDAGVHFVRAIQKFQTHEACTTLASLAVFDPSSAVGIAATDALRDVPLDFFVPDLLDAMSTETDLQQHIFTKANGEFVIQQMQVRELRRQFEGQAFEKLMVVDRGRVAPTLGLLSDEVLAQGAVNATTSGVVAQAPAPKNQVAERVAQTEAERLLSDAKDQSQATNREQRLIQSRIVRVLREVTKLELGEDPREWWNWWEQLQESTTGPKGWSVRYNEDRSTPIYVRETVRAASYAVRAISPSTPMVSETTRRPSGPFVTGPSVSEFVAGMSLPVHVDCLAAETTIQTEEGLRPIESIQVGDMVVAQDIASGELKLKPVLRVTKRASSATKKLRFGDQEVTASYGHNWWVCGAGWMRTKELEPGMVVHTAKKTLKIEQVEEGEEIETYNLTVADFHTFFVGAERVLSYDGTEVVPTFQKAPGVPVAVLTADTKSK